WLRRMALARGRLRRPSRRRSGADRGGPGAARGSAPGEERGGGGRRLCAPEAHLGSRGAGHRGRLCRADRGAPEERRVSPAGRAPLLAAALAFLVWLPSVRGGF